MYETTRRNDCERPSSKYSAKHQPEDHPPPVVPLPIVCRCPVDPPVGAIWRSALRALWSQSSIGATIAREDRTKGACSWNCRHARSLHLVATVARFGGDIADDPMQFLGNLTLIDLASRRMDIAAAALQGIQSGRAG